MSYTNLTLLTDFYEFTMSQGYHSLNFNKKIVVFDLFYRNNPCNGGYSIFAGLDQVIDYIKNINFSDEDILYLKSQGCFDSSFLDMLKDFKFTGDIYSVKEGTVIFPNEPILKVKAPIIQAQLIEGALLNIINHQCLIATKASRIVYSAGDEPVLEMGLRRAQGPDAAIFGTRASIIGGCTSSSNVLAGKIFNIPINGTLAHSWVMSFPDELTAFREYVKVFPDKAILLVDTYDTINSGIPNAIKVFNEMQNNNIKLENYGIRLDSGDISYISKIAKKMLTDAGHEKALICASSNLDEHLIQNLKAQGCKISLWGVGTSLITSKDCPSFDGVYKLVAEIDQNNKTIPKIKISENTGKITTPSIKKVYRLIDKESNKFKADIITLEHEVIDTSKDLTIFDPLVTWKKMTLKANTFYAQELLIPIFINGLCVYDSPSVIDIKKYCSSQVSMLWKEYRRLSNPQIFPVDLSKELWDLKRKMIKDVVVKKNNI
jgi:nicotinate phosphoribosyltransferase